MVERHLLAMITDIMYANLHDILYNLFFMKPNVDFAFNY